MLHDRWYYNLLASSVVIAAIVLALYDSDFYHHSISKAVVAYNWFGNHGQRQSFTQPRRLLPNPSFDDPIRWGTYQAGLYFGIRSRTYPFHVNAGFLWTCLEKACSDTLRHWSRQEDRLRKYGWLQHDGKTFGFQQIEDHISGYNIHTQYVNLLPSVKKDRLMHLFSNQFKLATRKKTLKRKSNYVSLFYYIDLSCGDDGIPHSCRKELLRSEGNIFKIENNKSKKCITNEKDEECLYQLLTTSTSTLNKTELSLRQTFPSSISARVEARVQNQKGSVKSFDVRFQGFAGANIVHVKEKIASQRLSSATCEDEDSIEAKYDFLGWENCEKRVKEQFSEKELIYLNNTLEDKSLLVVFQVFLELKDEDAILMEDDVVMDVIFMEKKLEDEETNEHTMEAKKQVKEWEERIKSTSSIKMTLIEAADMKRDAFERQFQSTFQLSDATAWNTSQVEFAKAGFSNLIGGLSYFYGSYVVKMVVSQGQTYGTHTSTPFPLFFAIPSKSFFPRGFLWDEGFHQLVILPFNQEITEEVILHWLGAMNANGYIPREMILGKVASARVPVEFLFQIPTNANPPTFLLCLEKYLNMKKVSNEKKKAFMQQIFPSLVAWYEWFLASQQVSHVIESDHRKTDPLTNATSHEVTKQSQVRTLHAFQWRGRDPLDDRLNAITLASGFDDYPRASSPSKEELHVDLLCWMIRYTTILARIATFIGQEEKIIQNFMDQKSAYLETLDIVHWNDTTQTYSDLGNHSADGFMMKTQVARCRNTMGEIADYPASKTQCPESHPQFLFLLGDGHGGFLMRNVYVPRTIRMQHVYHIGYVSIFPLILRILPADSPKLEALLMSIRDPAHLWTPYGLRSLSTRDPFFEVGNRPDDKPYWRGAIWINVNYLALDALMYYSKQDGPFQQMIKDTYTELRQNVISNIYSEYMRTGYFWEQYNGNERMKKSFGRGKRSHPFTGWTALVVNIMAEVYIHDER